MRTVVDIAQAHTRVEMVCGTQRGSVPHSPDLGVDWLAIQDEPLSANALRMLHLDIDQQFRIHLPELKFVRVEFTHAPEAPGQVRAVVAWRPAELEGAVTLQETTV